MNHWKRMALTGFLISTAALADIGYDEKTGKISCTGTCTTTVGGGTITICQGKVCISSPIKSMPANPSKPGGTT